MQQEGRSWGDQCYFIEVYHMVGHTHQDSFGSTLHVGLYDMAATEQVQYRSIISPYFLDINARVYRHAALLVAVHNVRA